MTNCLRLAAVLALGLVLSGVTQGGASAAEPPKIAKPRPAPQTPPQVAPLPPAVFDNKLAIGGQDVKARKVDTRLSVEVMVNGKGPYRFVVDSGADTSVIGLHIARALELPLGAPAILDGMTSRNVVDRVKVDELSLGASSVKNLQLPALQEDDVGSDGIIGIDALTQQRLMMDFDKRLIKVEDARKPEPYEPGEIVITARRQRGQLILTHVRAAGVSLDAVIDTGSEITIGNLALRDKLLGRNRDKFTTIPVIGVTGVSQNLQISTIDELELGPVMLRDVPIAFADVPPFKVFGLSDEPALLLGTDILETFKRVSLDFKARKVRFQLRRCETEGVTISTAPDIFTRLSGSGGADVCGRFG
jgi:predicted aspartyl protease